MATKKPQIRKLLKLRALLETKQNLEEVYAKLEMAIDEVKNDIVNDFGQGLHEIDDKALGIKLSFHAVKVTHTEYIRPIPHWQSISLRFKNLMLAYIKRAKLSDKEKTRITKNIISKYDEARNTFTSEKNEERIYISFY
jgi:hypothetical protein